MHQNTPPTLHPGRSQAARWPFFVNNRPYLLRNVQSSRGNVISLYRYGTRLPHGWGPGSPSPRGVREPQPGDSLPSRATLLAAAAAAGFAGGWEHFLVRALYDESSRRDLSHMTGGYHYTIVT